MSRTTSEGELAPRPPSGSRSSVLPSDGNPTPRRQRCTSTGDASPRRTSLAALVATASIATAGSTAEIRSKRLRRSSTGSFKDSERQPRRTNGTVWIGQLPETYVDRELHLSKLFGRFGKVLSCTVRQKPGYRRNWALLTFVHPSAVNDAVESALNGEVTVEDEEGEHCALVVRRAKIDAELRRSDTGALGQIWMTQNDKVAAAVRIQKAVRGRLTRQKGKLAAAHRIQTGKRNQSRSGQNVNEWVQSKNTTARWSPQVAQAVQNHSRELADYMQWLRCESKASKPVVNRRDDILSEMRRAMRVPSQTQLVAVGATIFALAVACVILLALLVGASSDLAEEKKRSTATQELVEVRARSVSAGVGRCLASTIANPTGAHISATETIVGAAFELTVTVYSIDAVQCAGPMSVNRVMFTDYASAVSKVVSCVPSASTSTPPSDLRVTEPSVLIDGVTPFYHTSVCSVGADVLALGNYDIQLVHAANAPSDLNTGGVASSSGIASSAGAYCGVCTGSPVKVVGGPTESVSFNTLGEFSVAVSAACTRGIRSVAVETSTDTWEPCTLTAATRNAIVADTAPRSGSCTIAAPQDANAYSQYYLSVAVFGDLSVECGRHTPTFCSTNQKVQSNACVPCEAGATRPAGDISTGPDTTCTPTICVENERVLNNVCTECPYGKTRPTWQGVSDPRERLPSDRPTTASRNNLQLNYATLADTYCWPSRCDGGASNMNDYVSGTSGTRRSCAEHSDCCWGLCNVGVCSG